ncbi:rap1 GTPase-activating protein 2-like, partial [Vicugna pacos]|uniref:Rap1 GTPase-activating protein 2-like n=1 Tax=Vicugna pacos TaxID=30538 RepID=A0ABM5BIF4_VICPA
EEALALGCRDSFWQFHRQPPVAAATVKNQSLSPIKRRSGLFPRLHTGSEGQGDSRTRRLFASNNPMTPDGGHSSQEINSDTSSNPSTLEICPNKEKALVKLKENGRANISRLSSSTSSFSSTGGEGEAMEECDSGSNQPSITSPFKQEVFVYSPSPSSESPSLGAAATPIIMSQNPMGVKSRNSPRSNLKFCFDKLSHTSSSAVRVTPPTFHPPPPSWGWRKRTPHTSHGGGLAWVWVVRSGGDAIGHQLTFATARMLEPHSWTHADVSWEVLAPGTSCPFLGSSES